MKSVKLQKILVCTTLVASMTGLTAIAATNPAGNTTPNTGGSIATPPFNPATSSGQSGINGQNSGTLANPADPNTSLPTVNAPQGVENESIQEAVAACPLQEASEEAIAEAMEIIKIVPDVDEIFNNKTEAAKGCFAASSKVMNLALEIPSFDGFNSAAAQIIKRNLTSMIEQKQKEFLAMGCEIADQALLSALSPVQDYLVKYNNKVGSFNGLLGNLDMGAGYEGSNGNFFDGIAGSIGSTITEAQGRIDQDSQAMKDTADRLAGEYKDILDKAPPISGGGFGGGMNGGGTGTTDPVPPTNTGSNNARSFAAAPASLPPTATQSQSAPVASSPAPSAAPSSSANPYGGAPQTPSATNPF